MKSTKYKTKYKIHLGGLHLQNIIIIIIKTLVQMQIPKTFNSTVLNINHL